MYFFFCEKLLILISTLKFFKKSIYILGKKYKNIYLFYENMYLFFKINSSVSLCEALKPISICQNYDLLRT